MGMMHWRKSPNIFLTLIRIYKKTHTSGYAGSSSGAVHDHLDACDGITHMHFGIESVPGPLGEEIHFCLVLQLQ